MAFIIPYVGSTTNKILKLPSYHSFSLIPLKASLHPIYDVATVSTYIAYFTAQYWTGENRMDVEIFAFIMAMIWNFTHEHDPMIFVFLWLIGGASHFISGSFLAGGNQVEAENFHVGVKLGGYISFMLLVFDLLDVVTGF